MREVTAKRLKEVFENLPFEAQSRIYVNTLKSGYALRDYEHLQDDYFEAYHELNGSKMVKSMVSTNAPVAAFEMMSRHTKLEYPSSQESVLSLTIQIRIKRKKNLTDDDKTLLRKLSFFERKRLSFTLSKIFNR